jgi:phosphatidate cytidylyltransferase
MSRNLLARILVAAAAIPIILWIAYQGGAWLFGMIMLFALVGLVEFLFNEGFKPNGVLFWLAAATVVLLLVSLSAPDLSGVRLFPFSDGNDNTLPAMVIITVFYILTAMLMSVGKRSPAELFRGHSRLVWGVLYVGLLYPVVYRLGNGMNGISGGDSLLFLFAVLWIGDTAAMGVGKQLGKHRLAPGVSPNKTVEGFVGGVIAAAVVGLVMFYWKFQSLGVLSVIVLAVGCSVFGQLGDLVESMWKRSLGIKDSSAIIPGHGGVLDRFDSLLFAAPFMYGFLHVIR